MVIKSSSVKSLAVFIDFENLALGFHGRNDRFEIKHVLTRLLEKGKIVAKKAYADWHRFSFYTSSLHEAAIELVEIPRRAQTGKNSADIRLCVDAMDLAYSKEHIDTFVIVSGDSDFSPLVSKLKELGKHVIGLGMTNSTSNLLRDNCDEFIYYEDLTQAAIPEVAFKSEIPDTKRKAFLLLAHAYNALRRDNREIIHSSTLKETMRRMKPSFNENYHGYRSFSLLLEDAAREGFLSLATDSKSGTYVVTHLNMAIDESANTTKSPPTQHENLHPHNQDDNRENNHQRSHRRFNNRRPQHFQPRRQNEGDKTTAQQEALEETKNGMEEQSGQNFQESHKAEQTNPMTFDPGSSRDGQNGKQFLQTPHATGGSHEGGQSHEQESVHHQANETQTKRSTPHDHSEREPEPSSLKSNSAVSPEGTPTNIESSPQVAEQKKNQKPWRSRNPRNQKNQNPRPQKSRKADTKPSDQVLADPLLQKPQENS